MLLSAKATSQGTESNRLNLHLAVPRLLLVATLTAGEAVTHRPLGIAALSPVSNLCSPWDCRSE